MYQKLKEEPIEPPKELEQKKEKPFFERLDDIDKIIEEANQEECTSNY